MGVHLPPESMENVADSLLAACDILLTSCEIGLLKTRSISSRVLSLASGMHRI